MTMRIFRKKFSTFSKESFQISSSSFFVSTRSNAITRATIDRCDCITFSSPLHQTRRASCVDYNWAVHCRYAVVTSTYTSSSSAAANVPRTQPSLRRDIIELWVKFIKFIDITSHKFTLIFSYIQQVWHFSSMPSSIFTTKSIVPHFLIGTGENRGEQAMVKSVRFASSFSFLFFPSTRKEKSTLESEVKVCFIFVCAVQ